MFDIGFPELGVIAVVALVVLGPERLPEIMRQAGKWYRQLMQLRTELMSQVAEAQRTFREEIEAVERAANLDLSISVTPDPALPPPPLRQVPAYRRQPDKAQEAGPFGLPAWYRDTATEVEVPALADALASALSLRPIAADPLVGHAYVTSTKLLTAPIHPFDDPWEAVAPKRPRVAVRTNGRSSRPRADAVAPVAAAIAVPDSGAVAADDADRASREGTVITLFEAGLHTRETASSALDMSVAEFEKRIATRREAMAVA